MIEATSMAERVTFFGDISGIRPADLHAFVEVTRHHQIGGSFPSRDKTSPDTEIIDRVTQILIQAGVASAAPIILCNSVQERAEEIFNTCHRRNVETGLGQYWIIDQNPDLLAAAMKSIVSPDVKRSVREAILESIAVINLGSLKGYDHRDQTGIRICSLPSPLIPFPVHPTPASE